MSEFWGPRSLLSLPRSRSPNRAGYIHHGTSMVNSFHIIIDNSYFVHPRLFTTQFNGFPVSCVPRCFCSVWLTTTISTAINMNRNAIRPKCAGAFSGYYLLNTLWYCAGNCTLNKLKAKRKHTEQIRTIINEHRYFPIRLPLRMIAAITAWFGSWLGCGMLLVCCVRLAHHPPPQQYRSLQMIYLHCCAKCDPYIFTLSSHPSPVCNFIYLSQFVSLISYAGGALLAKYWDKTAHTRANIIYKHFLKLFAYHYQWCLVSDGQYCQWKRKAGGRHIKPGEVDEYPRFGSPKFLFISPGAQPLRWMRKVNGKYLCSWAGNIVNKHILPSASGVTFGMYRQY